LTHDCHEPRDIPAYDYAGVYIVDYGQIGLVSEQARISTGSGSVAGKHFNEKIFLPVAHTSLQKNFNV
jgi:hypothetical protein